MRCDARALITFSAWSDENMTERLTLPVLPLREVVLFPGVTTVIGAGRPATLRAIETASKSEGRLIFAVSQRDNVDQVTPGVLYTMGTIARVGQVQRGLNGVQILLHGERRAMAVHYTEADGHMQAVVRDGPDLPPLQENEAAFVARYRALRGRAAEVGQKA